MDGREPNIGVGAGATACDGLGADTAPKVCVWPTAPEGDAGAWPSAPNTCVERTDGLEPACAVDGAAGATAPNICVAWTGWLGAAAGGAAAADAASAPNARVAEDEAGAAAGAPNNCVECALRFGSG
ncbi:MAG: hypothetical protein ACOX6T_18020 [Myxococcales bacterium]